MKELFIENISNSQVLVDFVIGVGSVKEQKDKNYNKYYDLELVDSSGVVKGKIWSDRIDRVDQSALVPGNVVLISGKVTEFRGELQIIIEDLSAMSEGTYELSDFMMKSVYSLDKMWEKLQNYIQEIQNPSIKELLNNCINKYQEQIKKSPAAERLHHGFMGGLVEHVLELLSMMDSMKKIYPEADYDQVAAGVILHDIGKVRELGFDGFSIIRTDEGKMIGHVISSYEIFLDSVPEGFDENLKMKIGHIILSHHGILEYGSPVVPKTIEAAIVHQLDEMSSRIRQYKRVIDETTSDGSFTKKDWALDTEVYLK